MENAEEVMQLLEEFTKARPKEIPRELEEYLAHVAKSGDPVFQWSLVKSLFREKLINVITDFYESTLTVELPPCPNVEPFSYERMKASLLERFDSFCSAPFTVQRICELLTNPRKEYNRADKYMRAIEKNILVVSTREPGTGKRPLECDSHSDTVLNGMPEMKLSDGGLLHIPTDLPYLGAPPASNDVTVETSEPAANRQINETVGLDLNGDSTHIQIDTTGSASKPWEIQESSKPIISLMDEENKNTDLSSETSEESPRLNTSVIHSSDPTKLAEESNQGSSESDTKIESLSLGLASNIEDKTQPTTCNDFEKESSVSLTPEPTLRPSFSESELPDMGSGSPNTACIGSVDSSADCADVPVGLGSPLSSTAIVSSEESGCGSDENEVSSTPADTNFVKFEVPEVDEATNSEAEATDGNSVQCSDMESNSQDANLDLPDSEVNSSDKIIETNETENILSINEVGITMPSRADEEVSLECNESEITGMPTVTSPDSPNVSTVDSQGEDGSLDLNTCDQASAILSLEEVKNEETDLHPDSSDDISLEKSSMVVNELHVSKVESCNEADSASNSEINLLVSQNSDLTIESNPENSVVIGSPNTSSTMNIIKNSEEITVNELPENSDLSSNSEEDALVIKSCQGVSIEEELKPTESLSGNETTEAVFCHEKREESVIHSLSSVSTDNQREMITIEEISVDPSCETEEEAMDVDDTSNQMMVSEGENEGEPMDQSDQTQS